MDAKEITDAFSELITRSTRVATVCNRYANIYKGLDISTRIVIFLIGAVIGIMGTYKSSANTTDNNIVIVLAILGGIVSVLEGVKSAFNLASRGLTLENVYLKALAITRKVNALRLANLPPDKLEEQMEIYHTRLDELCITQYNINIVNLSSTDTQAAKLTNQTVRRRNVVPHGGLTIVGVDDA